MSNQNQTQQQPSETDDQIIDRTTPLAKLEQYCANEGSRDARLIAFMKFINTPPHESWKRNHPNPKLGKYIPIGFVEGLLRKIFHEYRVEVLQQTLMLNGIQTTVRLHYFDRFVDHCWKYQDGVGGAGLQADDKKPDGIAHGAVMMAAPSSKSFAIKDAAESIGRLFGADISRKDSMDFDAPQQTAPQSQSSKPQKNTTLEL